jgi:hypothetical protein
MRARRHTSGVMRVLGMTLRVDNKMTKGSDQHMNQLTNKPSYSYQKQHSPGMADGRTELYVPDDVPAAVVDRLRDHPHEADASPTVHQVHAPSHLHQ